MYERRLRVYDEVRKILSIIFTTAKPSTDDLRKFGSSVSEADFLFGPEIREYIDKIDKFCIDLRDLNVNLEAIPLGEEKTKMVKERSEKLEWFRKQFGPAKNKFKKYFDISKL